MRGRQQVRKSEKPGFFEKPGFSLFMNIILYNGQVWDSTWGHHKNLVAALAQEHQVAVIDLIDYGLRYAVKLQGRHYPAPEGVKLVKRQTTLPAGVLFGIYTELRNLWDFIKVERGFAPAKSALLMTYLTSGGLLTVLLAKCLGKKIVLVYADDYAEFLRHKSALIGWFTEHIGTPLVAKCADAIVVTAQKLQEDLARFNPHITVIPNGVDVRQFQQADAAAEKEITSEVKPFTVGFVGGFGNWVDFDLVLTVAAALPDVQFNLIGSGDQFEAVCRKAHTLPNVWLPGILPHERIPQQLAAMDVCLIPFKINRITDRVSPVKLFEYWALRKPVIATRFYEVQRIAAGKVIFVDNSADLQKAITQLREQPEFREQIAQAGFQAVRAYDWLELGQKYLELIKQIYDSKALTCSDRM